MKYNVGDRVLIVGYRTSAMNSFGEMDRYLNTIMTIRDICSGNPLLPYKMYEDCDDPNMNNGWFWGDNMIVGKVIDDNVVVECT